MKKFNEVINALKALGYKDAYRADVEVLDQDRWKVTLNGEVIGIYDFIKHTFVD